MLNVDDHYFVCAPKKEVGCRGKVMALWLHRAEALRRLLAKSLRPTWPSAWLFEILSTGRHTSIWIFLLL